MSAPIYVRSGEGEGSETRDGRQGMGDKGRFGDKEPSPVSKPSPSKPSPVSRPLPITVDLLLHFYQLDAEVEFLAGHLVVCVQSDHCLVLCCHSDRERLSHHISEEHTLADVQIF